MTIRTQRTYSTPVYVEVGSKRVFACALDWPGWCRSGKDERQALQALADYAARYAAVPSVAGLDFSAETATTFEVRERLPGSATTDFGAPDRVPSSDREPLGPAEADRLAALVAAAWTTLDRVVAGAPAALRKGPRGGGRDRDAVFEHVLAAETAYARKLGVRQRQPSLGDVAAISALRAGILGAIRQAAETTALGESGWLPRYAARRIAWHVLDHAWEIEDRSGR
ncbi:MAG TPA: hypothetical protein VIO35_08385 [Chloroflexota bacterium]